MRLNGNKEVMDSICSRFWLDLHSPIQHKSAQEIYYDPRSHLGLGVDA
jgi:hypothetical protein